MVRQTTSSGKNRVTECGAGRMEIRYGIPFLYLSGTHQDMGFQYGSLLRGPLKEILGRLDGIRSAIGSLFPFFLRPLVRLRLSLKAAGAKRKIPREYLDELRGVAKGSGQPLKELVFASACAEILIGFGCTSILSRTKNGLLHSRNLDFFPPFLGRYPAVVNYRPTGKNPYTLVGFTGYLPALTGMNPGGITVSLNESSRTGKTGGRKNALLGYALRTILENASNLKEADRIVKDIRTDQGWVLAVGGGKEGSGVLYDIAGDAQHANRQGRRKAIYAVNTFVNESFMKKYQCVTRAGHAINHARKAILEKTAGRISDAVTAVKALADTDVYGFQNIPGDSTVNNYRTLQAVIMDPVTRRVCFSSAAAYAAQATFYRYDISSGKVSVFRKAGKFFRQKSTDELVRWMDGLYSGPLTTLHKTLERKRLSAFQMEALFFLQNLPGFKMPWDRILTLADEALETHPGHPQFMRWKGEALFRLKKFHDAAGTLKKALAVPSISPNDQMACHALLAECCFALGMRELTAFHGEKALKILVDFAAGPTEKRLKKRLFRLLSSGKK